MLSYNLHKKDPKRFFLKPKFIANFGTPKSARNSWILLIDVGVNLAYKVRYLVNNPFKFWTAERIFHERSMEENNSHLPDICKEWWGMDTGQEQRLVTNRIWS